MNLYKELRHPFLRGILFVLAGIAVCLLADYIVPSLVIILGLLLILNSLVVLSEAKLPNRLSMHKLLLLVSALVSFACGIIFIIKPSVTATVIFLLTGVWLLIASVTGIVHSGSRVRKMRMDRWQLFVSMVVLVFALLIFADPAGVAVLLIFAAGIYLFLCGCLFIAVTIILSNRHRINLDEINSYLPAFLRYAR